MAAINGLSLSFLPSDIAIPPDPDPSPSDCDCLVRCFMRVDGPNRAAAGFSSPLSRPSLQWGVLNGESRGERACRIPDSMGPPTRPLTRPPSVRLYSGRSQARVKPFPSAAPRSLLAQSVVAVGESYARSRRASDGAAADSGDGTCLVTD